MSYDTTPERDRELLRLLTGEASAQEAQRLRAALEQEPELARRYARLRRTWEGLELPTPAPAPPGFAQRVAARLPEVSPGPGGILGLAGAPLWARTAAASALVLGLGAGVFLGRGLDPELSWASAGDPAAEEMTLVETEPGLADAYRQVLYGEETP